VTTQISLSIEGTARLPIEAIWPDGDEPDEPTVADVMQALVDQGFGTAYDLIVNDFVSDLNAVFVVRRPNPLVGQLRLDGTEEPPMVVETGWLGEA